ncbi:MAG: fasciclin domain-containing protein [Bacteroidales bacterium]|nr:fasciclin domain-containing protein [Bacteroidales bacterium]
MKKIVQQCLCVLFVLFFIQCNDEADKYYERPDWLEPPVYEVLMKDGRFSRYLQCVDRTNYAKVLKGAGLYTVFAPNDVAFSAWLSEKSYASVADIPQTEVERLVAYSIVYSSWVLAHLGDYYSEGLYLHGAFKRQTNCYALPYRDPEFDNNWVLDSPVPAGYSDLYSNYKYLPVYTTAYFNSFPVSLTAYDYNVFYPEVTFTGKNVQGGTILKEDIRACNGIIHEVSTVNEPIDNIDAILHKSDYSVFKSLIDRKNLTGEYTFKNYTELPADITEKFQKILPDADIKTLYVKIYSSSSLSFSPIMENVVSLATGSVDPEKAGNTLFVPQNAVLTDFINSKLLKYYESVNELPQEIILQLINTHMVQEQIWPSMYEGSMNATGEYLNGEGRSGKKFDENGIVKKTVASNGFVFQTDKVIKSRFFETVYSEIFLNPAHTMLNRAYLNFYESSLREEVMQSPLNGYNSERYTMLNFPDALLQDDGFTYSTLTNSFSNSEMNTNAEDRLKRLMRMHIFPGVKNSEIDATVTDFSGANINYGQWGFTVTQYGDPIRFKDNQLQAAGNIEDNTFVTLSLQDSYINGDVYNVDRMLQYSPRETAAGDARFQDLTLWQYLDRARRENPNVSQFVDYVERCLKNADTDELAGIKPENYYTVLMPNNSAMQQARNRGYIKELAAVTTTDIEAMAQATQFVNAHILQGRVLVDDGLSYLYPYNPMEPSRYLASTLLKITNEELGLTNERTLIEITKTAAGLLNFVPQNIMQGSKVLVQAGVGSTLVLRVQRGVPTGSTIPNNYKSNRIACKAVLHEINNFFTFQEINP